MTIAPSLCTHYLFKLLWDASVGPSCRPCGCLSGPLIFCILYQQMRDDSRSKASVKANESPCLLQKNLIRELPTAVASILSPQMSSFYHQSRASEVYGATITLTIVATVAVAPRLASRRISQAPYWFDDWAIIVALVTQISFCTCRWARC